MSEFLAEAQVLITPDTTKFRALLATELAAITKGIPPVPVAIAPVVTGASVTQSKKVAVALREQALAEQLAGAGAIRAGTATTQLARAQGLAATAASKLALAEAEVANAASAVGAAQVTGTRSAAALGAAQRALDAALKTQNATLISAARNTLSLAEAQNAAATAALRNARAQAAQATSLGGISKGAGSAAAALGGVRGATLAASAPFLAGAVSVAAFAKAIQAAASLETDLNVFRVTARATAQEMENVREQAKLLGRDLSLPGVTASDAANTFLTLSRAGLSVQDSLAGARGTLQLAVAAQIGFADAAQLTASALNAFGLSGDEAVAVADTLTNAANASQASIAEMGIALRQSAAIADLAGFSFSETATFLTQLARQGLIGSDAGTSFRVSIQRLIAPTDEARKKLEQLHINLRDVNGDLRPEAFFELGDALERMGRAQGDATRQLIFGNDASRAAAFLARLNAEAFREQEKTLNRAGAAAEQAGARNEGFAGKLENAKNQVTAFGIEIGELSLPAVGLAVDGVAGFFGALATQIADSREALSGFGEDAEKLREFLTALSEGSGFPDFADDVAQGARLISGEIGRASDATDAFFADLLGVETSTSSAATGVKKLSDEERRFAEAIHDANRPLSEQTEDLENLVTAAQKAAGAIGRLTGQVAGLEEGVTRARIAGDEGGEFELLKQERDRLQRLLAIQENIVAQGGAGAATARRNIREQLLPQLESITNEIRAIIAGQVSESKSLADDAARARDERDRNIIDAIGLDEQKKNNAVIAAQATAGLQDDINIQINLRNFYKNKIAQVGKTVKDVKLAAQVIAGFIQDFNAAVTEIADLQRQQKEAAQAERREARERLRESLQLDIDIAGATGNRSKEIRARQAEIDRIKLEIRQTREGSNQRKRLILELRQAQKELEELKKAKEETAKTAQQTFAQQTFDFMQKQEGFAANLLGNLIPGFATAGLVGGSRTDPGAGLQAQAATKSGGPTFGQAATEVDILKEMLRVLRAISAGRAAPEAGFQRAQMSAVMDITGGGGQAVN